MAGPIEKSIVAFFRLFVLIVGLSFVGMGVYGLLDFDRREAIIGNPLWFIAIAVGIAFVRFARPMNLYWWGKE
jgi:quinol-cytochrome oxidoreductase complex cytochrome b subunit